MWQEIKMGVFAARSELHLMSPQEGRNAVATCSLAEPPPGLRYPLAALDPKPAAALDTATTAQQRNPPGTEATTANGAQAVTLAAPASSAEGFPRVLSGADIAGHFARHSTQDAQAGRQSFQLIVQQDSIERVCPGCRVTRGSGEIKYEADRVCIRWTRGTFPDSGCYQLVQTEPARFVLRGLGSERAIRLSVRE